ncbi:cellulase family glycosylhydrolase [Streptomyces sp. HPF1205]|uniref:cellulase family glycosylhydrolase n=1 Tax=Streptomyces sp. HPF1205 TaxID=2873262 RepID=UPI001CEC7FA9|nr:cellulase family glycosylhydrolase [Streptomyces sp. HPF1205]
MSPLPPAKRRRTGLTAAVLSLFVGGVVALSTATADAAAGCSATDASSCTAAGAHTGTSAVRPHTAMSVTAAMQPGWNLGNTLDAIPDETSWGNPLVTKSLFDTVRAQGFRSVRIPVTWAGHEGPAPDYTIDPAFMSRVKQVVDWALSDGLYVILNTHHDSWEWISSMPTDHDGVRSRFDKTWTQIAGTFKDEPDRLVLESINEPQFSNVTDAQAAPLLDELNTSFHDIVRASGGNNATRYLLLPTLGDTPSQADMDSLYATITALHDPNLIASVHYYGFWPFSVNIAGFTRFDANTQQDMTTDFGLMHSEFVARGIPVVLGEYSLLSYPDYTKPESVEYGEALKYFEALGYQARVNGVTTELWDAGSYINRGTLQLRDPHLFAQIRSSWTTRSGTASSDNVFLPKSGAITDQTLTLNTNGTSFQGLTQGGTWLKYGSDYTVAGTQLTLKASALTRLAASRSYGVDATLQARFSQGVPWQINVVTYDTPVLSNASGTTSSLTVPTQFRGDLLATMEAKYADGSNAGTATWTSYQEFNSTFSPDYGNNAITLTSDFLNSLTDGARVTLTFHFWSGATVTYYVTRSGTTVTGSTS